MHIHRELGRVWVFIVGVTAIICSRVLFTFIADAEGPNLLVVGVLALGLWGGGFVLYAFASRLFPRVATVSPRVASVCMVGIQIALTTLLYMLVRLELV